MNKKPGRKSAAELAIVRPEPEHVTDRPHALPAPAHLAPATQAWWDAVLSEYQLEPHHLRLLQAAGEAWDRMCQARDAIAERGLTFMTAQSEPRTRPEVAIERDSRLAFVRIVRELDLDVDAPGEGRTRPPALLSNRRI